MQPNLKKKQQLYTENPIQVQHRVEQCAVFGTNSNIG